MGIKVTQSEPLITGETFARMVGLGRCELVKGRIVEVTPPGFEHGKVEGKGYRLIDDFVIANKLGEVAVGEVGMYVKRNPDVVRAADIVFISNEQYAKRNASLAFLDVAPELAVEVLSPTNTMAEMLQKLQEYFDFGVRLVWLVDPEKKRVYAYRSMTDFRLFEADDQVPGDHVLPGFSMPVAKFFE